MAGTFVTDEGFKKKTFSEIKIEYENLFKGIFGNDIDLDEEGPFGQVIAELSKRDIDLWELAEEIYTSRNPNDATGRSLDSVSNETGVKRIDATETRVEDVLLFGDEGTLVTEGSKAKQELKPLTYSILSDGTITKTAARFIDLEPDAPSPGGGETYTVTIDVTPYTYVADPGDTKAIVINELKTLIEAGSFTGTVTNEDDTNLRITDNVNDFSITWTVTLTKNLLASAGVFEADETGPNTLPANTLNTIATPISGWDSVNNPIQGTTGRDVETDQELRLRRAKTFLGGNATDDNTKNNLLNNVDGIISAKVISNRTSDTDVDGRPPKSFEAIVEGGDDADIALVIWSSQPSGIEPFGNTTEIITDSEGNPQEVGFSRAEPVYIHAKVKRDFNPEEEYPVNGDDLIKQSIVDFALVTFFAGDDVVRQKLNTPVYEVPGISDILIELDDTPNPGDSPTFAVKNIPINSRQVAAFDIARIIVEVLTP